MESPLDVGSFFPEKTKFLYLTWNQENSSEGSSSVVNFLYKKTQLEKPNYIALCQQEAKNDPQGFSLGERLEQKLGTYTLHEKIGLKGIINLKTGLSETSFSLLVRKNYFHPRGFTKGKVRFSQIKRTKGLVWIKFFVGRQPVVFSCSHFDASSSKKRQENLQHSLTELEKISPQGDYFLGGDLNFRQKKEPQRVHLSKRQFVNQYLSSKKGYKKIYQKDELNTLVAKKSLDLSCNDLKTSRFFYPPTYKRFHNTKVQKKSCAYLSSGAQDSLLTKQSGAQCFFGMDYGSKDLDEPVDFSELKLGYLDRLCWKKNHRIKLKKEWPLSSVVSSDHMPLAFLLEHLPI